VIATVQELIRQERRAGASDQAIATLLRASRIKAPEGHHHWTRVSVRAAVGEDASGHRPRPRPCGGWSVIEHWTTSELAEHIQAARSEATRLAALAREEPDPTRQSSLRHWAKRNHQRAMRYAAELARRSA
jgi:hypothetical protein